MILFRVIVWIFLSWLGFDLILFWLPLLAVGKKRDLLPPGEPDAAVQPSFAILAACRDGATCIPGFVKSFREQLYPADRIRLFLVADNCSDSSAELARSLGMTVFERHDLATAGKGNAISEFLFRELQSIPFDALLVLDIDARVDDLFLRRSAGILQPGRALVTACATFAKNPEETLFAHTGTIIQALLRLHQEGRAALGLDAILYGSHGYLLSREALARLGWRTTTGQIAEDMELRLRCTLYEIPVRYAPDLAVFNEVTTDARQAHDQRRRWNSTYLPLIPQYLGPLLERGLTGDWKSLEALFGLLLLPSFANLFLYLTLTFLMTGILSAMDPRWSGAAIAVGILWAMDIAYFLVAFRTLRIPLRLREWQGFAAHLWIRFLALVEGVFFVRVKVWPPAPHGED